jgi:mono/diheme cytochrome c family protein
MIKIFISLIMLLALLSFNVQKKSVGNRKFEFNTKGINYFQPVNDPGAALYQKYCLSCHQKDGSGVPNTFPPLKNSNWVNGDPNRLIKIVLHGLQGEIEVNDEVYSQIMPNQSNLSDEQIADILSYIRKNFGNNAKTVKPDEIKLIRKQLNPK